MAGILVPTILLFGQILANKLFIPTLEILGGMIVVLIGSRVWIIRDRYVMKRWVRIHYSILIYNAAIFMIWFMIWMRSPNQ